MSSLSDGVHTTMNTFPSVEQQVEAPDDCLQRAGMLGRFFQSQADDILTDDELLDLFRIIKQILRKRPDTERVAKLLFCISYALGDHVKFSKPLHEDRILFWDNINHAGTLGVVQLTTGSSCCRTGVSNGEGAAAAAAAAAATIFPEEPTDSRWLDESEDSPNSPLSRLLSATSCLENNVATTPQSHHYRHPHHQHHPSIDSGFNQTDDTSTDSYSVRPYTNFRTLLNQHLSTAASQDTVDERYPHLHTLLSGALARTPTEVLMEPKQRGFYYQDGRIAREPALLQRYAEQGVLTQASLMRKRKRQLPDPGYPFELATLSVSSKKPKIPHRHGEFEQRRDDIISRMRSITLSDLEQKASRLPADFTLAIELEPLTAGLDPTRTTEEAADLLEPALRILTVHSNMKPHLDNGMNQNGIYYNTDYFRLYLAFEQFQKSFTVLFPSDVADELAEASGTSTGEKDKDRERNANMKAYRGWIEPLLTETNWAAFRRNIVVGERMMQLTKVIGQGVLLMTKELSGSKLHLTFTNNEWEEFIHGLETGKWDHTIRWDSEPPLAQGDHDTDSMLVTELRLKFATRHWFHPDGTLASPDERRTSLRSSNHFGASFVPRSSSNSSITTTVTPTTVSGTPPYDAQKPPESISSSV